MHNVFPGNTFSSNELPFSKEVISEQPGDITTTQSQIFPRTRNSFKARIVPFSRAKEALKLVEQDIGNFKVEERKQFMKALEELEQSLTQFRLKILF